MTITWRGLNNLAAEAEANAALPAVASAAAAAKEEIEGGYAGDKSSESSSAEDEDELRSILPMLAGVAGIGQRTQLTLEDLLARGGTRRASAALAEDDEWL